VKDATFDNGLLKIELVREIPEAMKPRRIAINGATTAGNVHQIEPRRPDSDTTVPRVSDARHPASSKNGGDHAADDRFRRQCFRHQRAAASRDGLRSPEGRSDASSLSISEKRAILASWASDASAIASCPALRAPAGFRAPVTIDEILEALCELDGGPRHPPGGKPNRLRSTSRAMAA